MLYYMGKVFDKATNKEYKTKDGGLKAAKKAGLNLYDENGQLVYASEEPQDAPQTPQEGQEGAQENISTPEGGEGQEWANNEDTEAPEATMTDNVPEGALEENADGSMNAYDEDGQKVGTVSQEEAEAAVEAITDTFDGVPAVRIKGKVRRVFKGSLRIRNKPSWEMSAVRGATAFTEKIVTHVLAVDDKPMYRTLDGYFISGDPSHVEFVEG